MKILFLFCLLGLFTSTQVYAAAPLPENTVLVKSAIFIAKQIISANEQTNEITQNTTFSILSSAYAEDSYKCFYAGWPSHWITSDGQKYCQSPKKLSEYQNGKCKADELACQPILFSPGVCVDISTKEGRRDAYSHCEEKYKKKGSPVDYLEKLNIKDPESIQRILNATTEICHQSFRQSHLTMCTRLEQKVAQINKNINSKNQKISSSYCATCGQAITTMPEQTAQREIARVKVAIEENSPESIYNQLKNDYLASGECHRYSFLPKSDQEAFKIKLFRKEIESIRPASDSEVFSDQMGLDILINSAGINDDVATPLKNELKSLPKNGENEYEEKRLAFQAKVISILKSNLSNPTFQSVISDRVSTLFNKLGIQEDLILFL